MGHGKGNRKLSANVEIVDPEVHWPISLLDTPLPSLPLPPGTCATSSCWVTSEKMAPGRFCLIKWRKFRADILTGSEIITNENGTDFIPSTADAGGKNK